MRAVIGFAICVAVAHCLTLTEIFRDDFDSNDVNQSKWNLTTQNGETSTLQFYTPEAVTVENGSLVITTKKTKIKGKDYTSGRVDTKNFRFKYGEIEFRAKVPQGRGIWTMFSLVHYNCGIPIESCEFYPPSVDFDIGEDVKTQKVKTTLYFKGDSPTDLLNSSWELSNVSLSDGFYSYKLLWTPEELVWFVDDKEVFRVNDSKKIPKTDMNIEISVFVAGPTTGRDMGPPKETTVFPTRLLVDRVIVKEHRQMSHVLDASSLNLTWSVLGAIGGFLFLTALLVIVLLRIRRNLSAKVSSDEMPLSPIRFTQSPSINVAFDPELQVYFGLIEVPMANVEISDDLLGKGEHGMVHKGLVRGLRGQPSTTAVAIKSCLSSSSDPEIEALFLKEMKIMTKVGRHLNIVNLLGVVCKEKNLLILEYCPFGSLLKYLQTHRGAYLYPHVDHSGHLLPFDEKEHKRLEEQAAELHRRKTFPEENFDERVLSTNDCINFAYQICRGMEFLASKQIIHRDLAARNILLSQNKILKISDFGLARQWEKEYFSSVHVCFRYSFPQTLLQPLSQFKVLLPVKWMPPESIVQKKFSQKSDVWSYGILLWEIFSAGEVPFSNSGVGSYVADLVTWLQNGFHMERPFAAPFEMYLIMKKCWNLNVEGRPNFAQLRLDLEKLVNANYYSELDLPYQRFNLDYEELLFHAVKSEEGRFVVPENLLYINEESTF